MKFENTIIINKPINEVFAYLRNIENLPQWNYAISQTKQVTPGAVKVGTQYVQERSLPRQMTEKLEVTAYQSPTLLEISGGFGPFPQGTSTYRLTPIENTKTLLENKIALEIHGLLQIAAPLASMKLKGAVAQNLDVLKRIIEK